MFLKHTSTMQKGEKNMYFILDGQDQLLGILGELSKTL